MSAILLLLQGDENSSGLPWWVWLVLISALLLLLVIGLVRQSRPVAPLPEAEETAYGTKFEPGSEMEEVAVTAVESETEAT